MPQLSLHTPIGDLTISEEDGQILALDWGWGRDQSQTPILLDARDQLHAYFDGTRASFTLPLNPFGTEYCRRIWRHIAQIPPGVTQTYATAARLAGGSPRSVGLAMGRNPIPILIPCHRIVASTGLGGYSGGDGPPTKAFLLALERRHRPSQTTQSPDTGLQPGQPDPLPRSPQTPPAPLLPKLDLT